MSSSASAVADPTAPAPLPTFVWVICPFASVIP